MLTPILDIPKDRIAPPVEKETRFAVVMYGGVSLAIYIYGVAKELYSMVKATARTKRESADGQGEYLLAEDQLSEAEKVYRRAGKALGTKFVVDILSGTSAGGINAVYLAKALVNGQSVDLLKRIWLEQGDIGKLINDKDSAVSGLALKDPPSSLLNSHRMYYHLLKALHEMDMGKRIEAPDGLSPFVEELDLNITATDIRGLTVELPVSNAHVQEMRYRNVFRFHYSTMDAAGWEIEAGKGADENKEYSNDFTQANNPLLAYVARCTSSFPFAFEPMQLDDVKNVLSLKDFKQFYGYDPKTWNDFFKDYVKVDDEFSRRSFGDGGYIDNKPFSYATEALLRRRADQPVDRKLIYIDPSPEHPDTSPNAEGERPDALQNVLAALLSIPRYEPIREDLEKVIERNRLIQRVNEVISHIDFVPRLKKGVKNWQKDPILWANKYFDKELLDWFGISYATYHQLRVASVVENLQSAILRAFNWEEVGTGAEDFHSLIEGWRREYYSIDPNMAETHWSENDILFRLDTTWRMRRLVFLQNIINKLLKAAYPHGENIKEREKAVSEANQILIVSGIKDDIDSLDAEALRRELTSIKRELNDAYGHLRARGRKVRSQSLMARTPSDEHLKNFVNELTALKKALEAPVDNLKGKSYLNELARESREVIATGSTPTPALSDVLEQIEKTTSALAEHLPNKERRGYICQTLSFVGRKMKGAIGSKPGKAGGKDNRTLVQRCLSYYNDSFEYYDMLIFPIYYGTDVGESDEAEIIRISPEDADSLLNERRKAEGKLAGTTLANFGAFFAMEWRENDMLWGRLDAAECVIKALMPEGDERKTLIHDVQAAILQEDLTPRDEAAVYQAKAKTEKAEKEKLLTGKLKDHYELKEGETAALQQILARLATPGKLIQLFRDQYQVDRGFPPRDTLIVGSRALRVFGNLLNGLSNTHKQFSTPAKWLTSASSIFAGILAVALPNSFGNFLVAGYWVWLLYIFELLLVGAGLLFGSPALNQIGVASLIVTFLAHLTLTVFNNRLSGRSKWIRFPLLVLIGILGIGLLVAVVFLIYMGLLALGALPLPTGGIGEWLGGLIRR
ncbi:MAG: patatin-like protein [Anaerolineales bacterium]|nr:patatin-like protein [Anaerolineales bacterium]